MGSGGDARHGTCPAGTGRNPDGGEVFALKDVCLFTAAISLAAVLCCPTGGEAARRRRAAAAQLQNSHLVQAKHQPNPILKKPNFKHAKK